MNGAAAHLMHAGDEIIIMAFETTDQAPRPKQILVDKHNRYVCDLDPHDPPSGVLSSADQNPLGYDGLDRLSRPAGDF